MKVIEINATYGYGSTGLIVRDIGELLKKNGDEVRYAYQMGNCAPSEGHQIGSPADWKLHALYTRLLGKQGWLSIGATRKLLKYMDQEKPDLVHLHNIHANYINLPMLLKYLAKKNIATVVTLHDCWFLTGKCCHFVSAGCTRWKTGCGHCPKQKESPGSLFFDRSAEVAKEKRELFQNIKNLTVVGCSEWIADIAKESYVFRDCRVEQIYNGVDTDVFAPMNRQECKQKLGISAEFVMLGMANKWLDPKNRGVLETVAENLTENETLVLIGCTDAQRKELDSFSNITAVGFIKERELLAAYYHSADAFVNLTFEDTLPTVNMEAISCGTPVITYDSCGSPELVQEGKTGYIIPQSDSKALLKRWRDVQAGMLQRHICREIGLNMFGKIERYDEYLSLFSRCVSGGA